MNIKNLKSISVAVHKAHALQSKLTNKTSKMGHNGLLHVVTFLIFLLGVVTLLGSGSKLIGGGTLFGLTTPLDLSQLSNKFLILSFDVSYKLNLKSRK